jgi:hypothetical protein
MSAEIRVLVPRFDVCVGIEIRLRRKEVKGSTVLRDLSHHFARKPIVPRLRYDEHQLKRAARPSSRWNVHDAAFVHLDRKRFHVPNLTHGSML